MYLQQEYEPLVSADGDNWRMLPTFDVQFKPNPDEWEEAWLETRLYHFSLVALGKWIRKSEGSITALNPKLSHAKLPGSEFADDCTSICSMPLLTRLEYRESIIFGNATKVGYNNNKNYVSSLLLLHRCSPLRNFIPLTW